MGRAHSKTTWSGRGIAHEVTSIKELSALAKVRKEDWAATTSGARCGETAAAVVSPITPTTRPSRERVRSQPSTAEGDANATASTGVELGPIGWTTSYVGALPLTREAVLKRSRSCRRHDEMAVAELVPEISLGERNAV